MKNYEKGFILKSGSSDKAVLLVHGLTGGPAELRWIAGKMKRDGGYDVFCPVLPGHCDTLKSLKKTTWKDWYNVVKEEALRLKQHYRHVYVGGLCIGGMLGLMVDIECPGILSGVALWAPVLFLDGWNIPKAVVILPAAMKTPIRYVWSFKETHPYGVKNDFVRKMMQRMMEKNSMAYEIIPGVTIYELLKLSKILRKNLARVNVPTILIHSKIDDFTSIKSSEVIYNGISSSIKKLVVLHNSYHMITIDNEKATVLQETIDFFKSIERASESSSFETVIHQQTYQKPASAGE